MPGLIDMHTHLDPDYGDSLGRIWLSYGVTSVRNPSQNPYIGLEMRESFDMGRRAGPRVFCPARHSTAAHVLPGRHVDRVATASRGELAAASTFGVDFFKTYVRLPDRSADRHRLRARGAPPVTSHELYPARIWSRRRRASARHQPRGYSPRRARAPQLSGRDDTIIKSGMTLTPTIGIEGAFRDPRGRGQQARLRPAAGLYPVAVVAILADLPKKPDPRADCPSSLTGQR